MRDRYDQTSAYVTGIQAKYSNTYAQGILRKIAKAGFSSKAFGEMLHKHTGNQSAQWWIDTYYYLLENGEMEDVEEIMRKEEEPKRIDFVKNPFLSK